jgi:uncharacterized membrane protein
VRRDSHGYVRLITAHVTYARLVERAFQKIRQAGSGMPSVLIRQLETMTKIVEDATSEEQRALLLKHAALIFEASEQSVAQAAGCADVRRAYDKVLTAAGRGAAG